MKNELRSITWDGNSLILLDQRKIPREKEFVTCKTLEEVISAIKTMIVRGAPAIAMSGIFGLVLELKHAKHKPSFHEFCEKANLLLGSRPTAVNLRLAVEEFLERFDSTYFSSKPLEKIISDTENFAEGLLKKDLQSNLKIGKNGLNLFDSKEKTLSILTHCNTGALATAGHGTAIGMIRTLKEKGFDLTVYADETRPYHQGSRLTAWEMQEEDIPYYIIGDGMTAWLFQNRKVDAVIVGADRIASNGDTANKIGTCNAAIIAKEYKIPFYVAATATSFDFRIENGTEIPIEMRPNEELTQNSFLKDISGKPYLPEGVLSPINSKALNPSFDVTPAKFITAIITELGIISPVNAKTIKEVVGGR